MAKYHVCLPDCGADWDEYFEGSLGECFEAIREYHNGVEEATLKLVDDPRLGKLAEAKLQNGETYRIEEVIENSEDGKPFFYPVAEFVMEYGLSI